MSLSCLPLPLPGLESGGGGVDDMGLTPRGGPQERRKDQLLQARRTSLPMEGTERPVSRAGRHGGGSAAGRAPTRLEPRLGQAPRASSGWVGTVCVRAIWGPERRRVLGEEPRWVWDRAWTTETSGLRDRGTKRCYSKCCTNGPKTNGTDGAADPLGSAPK